MVSAAPPDDRATSSQRILEQEPALFRAIIETMREAVLITDANLDGLGPRIEYANPSFTSMTGYSLEELVGRSPRMLQGPRTDRATLDRLRAALEAGQTFFGTATNYRKDGGEFTNEWQMTPFRDQGGRITRWVATQRDVSERVRIETNQKMLLDELDHRVMNNLAAVQSIAARLGRTSTSIAEFRIALQQRLFALAQAQQAIAVAHWGSVPLDVLAWAQLAPFGDDAPGRVQVAGPETHLRPGVAVVLGLALHELGLNAVRHGSLSGSSGRVGLGWTVASGAGGDELRVEWAESGGPEVTPPSRRGFGMRLLEEVLARELRGTVRMVFDAPGARCLIAAPLADVVERRA